MPRRLIRRAAEAVEAMEAEDDAKARIDAFLGPAPKPRRTSAGSRRKAHIEEVRGRMARKDWEGMTAGKLVALYWL
ncbi:MAG: hypothetical protein ACPG1A_16115, partial [Halioglobus sp.]